MKREEDQTTNMFKKIFNFTHKPHSRQQRNKHATTNSFTDIKHKIRHNI